MAKSKVTMARRKGEDKAKMGHNKEDAGVRRRKGLTESATYRATCLPIASDTCLFSDLSVRVPHRAEHEERHRKPRLCPHGGGGV